MSPLLLKPNPMKRREEERKDENSGLMAGTLDYKLNIPLRRW